MYKRIIHKNERNIMLLLRKNEGDTDKNLFCSWNNSCVKMWINCGVTPHVQSKKMLLIKTQELNEKQETRKRGSWFISHRYINNSCGGGGGRMKRSFSSRSEVCKALASFIAVICSSRSCHSHAALPSCFPRLPPLFSCTRDFQRNPDYTLQNISDKNSAISSFTFTW